MTYMSSRILEVSRNRRGSGSNPSAFSFSSFSNACSFSIMIQYVYIINSPCLGENPKGGNWTSMDLPAANHSGATILHFRFRFKDKASHIGTLQAEGGWKSP